MLSKFTKSQGKKVVSLFLVLSFLLPTTLALVPAHRAHALIGILDINLESVPTIIEFLIENIALNMAQKMLEGIVNDTIDWANSGFEGNPAFATDLGGTLKDSADYVIGDYIENSESLGFLCSPIRNSVTLSLQRRYYSPQPESNRFQCSLSEVVDNIENFYGNFSDGGWDAFFHLTQNPSNNPYGAFLLAEAELNSKIAKAVDIQKSELDWSSGFLSFKGECNQYETALSEPDPVTGISTYGEAECVKWDEETKTPGTVINEQINDHLGSGVAKLITADSLNGLLSAFLNGLTQRYVFGDRGLFTTQSNKKAVRQELKDVDDDYIPDGWDYLNNVTGEPDNDGILDKCSYGLKISPNEAENPLPPNNENCIKSREVDRTGYYLPLCEDIGQFQNELGVFYEFIQRQHQILPTVSGTNSRAGWVQMNAGTGGLASVHTWGNKISIAIGNTSSVITTLNKYENPEFLKAQNLVANYRDWLNYQIRRIAKDGRLNDEDGPQDAVTSIRARTNEVLVYVGDLQDSIRDCNNPDFGAIDALLAPTIPAPDALEGEPAFIIGGGGGTTTTTVSCSADPATITLGQSMTWRAVSPYVGAIYTWTMTDVTNQPVGQDIGVQYVTRGVKSASVRVQATDTSGAPIDLSVACSNTVTVN